MGRIRNALTALTTKAAPGSELVVPSSSDGRAVTYQSFDLARHTNEVVSIAREWLAQQAAEPPLVAFTDGAPDYDHPLSVAMSRPSGADNAHLTQSDVWRFVTRQLGGPSKVGCFLLVVRDAAGRMAACWPRTDKDVRVVRDSREFVRGYEYRDGNTWRAMPRGIDVVWLRLVGDDLYSHHSPLHDVERSIRTDAEASKWLDFMLQNMGAPGGLLAIEGIEKAAAEQVRDFINLNLMGAPNAGKVEVAPGKAELIELRSKLSDVDFGPLKDRLELAIAGAYGIPAELLQLLVTAKTGEGLSGNAYREKRKIAYANRVIPWLRIIEERMGLVLGPMYGIDPADVRFDLSGIDALDDSPLEKAQALSAIMGSVRTIASVDERRALATAYGVELEPLDTPEAVAIPEIADRDRFLALAGRVALADAGPAEGKAYTPGGGAAEDAFYRLAKRAFASEQERLTEALASLGKSGALDDAAKALLDAVDEAAWEDAFADLITLTLAEAGYATASGFGVSFSATSPAAIAAAKQRATLLAGQVTGTTREAIRSLVADTIEDGGTVRDLANAIASTDIGPYGAMSVEHRSRLIARTEAHGSRMQGSWEGAQAASAEVGEMLKTWMTAGDDAVRDEHADIDGETVPIDEAFSNGLMYPSEPNCRCDVLYSVRGE